MYLHKSQINSGGIFELALMLLTCAAQQRQAHAINVISKLNNLYGPAIG